MKNLASLTFLLLIGYSSYSQVGINTTRPTSTLDVAGTIRVRGVKSDALLNPVQATKIVGMDELGNFVEVEIDENVILENNRLRAVDKVMEIGDAPELNLPILSDLNLVLLPGEPNTTKSVMRMNSIFGDMFLTGIMPGQDGQKIWLYPNSGDLTIVPNSLLSLFGNRIEGNGTIIVKQFEMIQLMYDAARGKWIPMKY